MLLLLRQLLASLNKKRQKNAILLIFAMTLSTITEIVSIALFAPFISIILGNKEFLNGDTFLIIDKYLETNNLIFLIILIFLISGTIRIVTLRWLYKFSGSVNNEIVSRAYDVIINEDYHKHIKKSKSNLIAVIHTYGEILLTEVIIPILYIIESIIFISLMSISLFIYNWKIFISIIFLLFIIFNFFFKRANTKLKLSSLKQVQLNENLLERLDTELNSIEYIQLGNHQKLCSENYSKYDKEYRLNFANYLITANLPRIVIEYLVLILIILLITFLYISGKISNILPLLASGALLLQKSLPYVQKIFNNWSAISQNKYAALSILKYSIQYKENKTKALTLLKNIDFKELTFNKVNFSYDNKNKTLKNINFTIKKGEKIAIMGPSGTGKTTLLRLICGLLKPSSGKILINGKEINNKKNDSHTSNWMRSIGYVPQKINLTGRTLRDNIVFNNKINKVSKIKIEDVIKITLLEDLIDRCNGLDSNILQNSFSLSGGENQRLAIARAIYQNSKLLIMDEPTSSLDIKTQKKLFNNLQKLRGITCIVITHKLETNYFFDKILEIRGNQLLETNHQK